MDQAVNVSGERQTYQVFMRNEAQAELVERLMGTRQRGTFVVVSDATVAKLYATQFVEELTSKGMDAHLIQVAAGETSKSLNSSKDVFSQLVRLGADRDTVLIAFGGGVVGDLAGFVAATYMRGISLVQIPTTLLAQVDSSVGGKVGLNLPEGKNLVGAFYEPEFVWIDTTYLQTLTPRDIRNGFAEVIKHALIARPSLLDDIEAALPGLVAGDTDVWSEHLCAAVQVKIDVVAEDYRERGLRRVLNFGHTLAHAIEAGQSYDDYNHGEAVAIGMRASLRLSVSHGRLPSEAAMRVEKILDDIGFPQLESGMLSDATLEFIRTDKKKSGDTYRLILLSEIGETEERAFTWDEIKSLFGSLRQDPSLES